jgi:hypothetical protein
VAYEWVKSTYTRKHCGILYNLYSLNLFETRMGQGQPIAICDFAHFIILPLSFQIQGTQSF